MMRAWLLVVMWLCGMGTSAQQDSTWVLYHGGMDLHDGVYADFKAFRFNSPTVPLERLRDEQGLAVKDIRTSLSRLYWQPDSGARQSIRKERLWGYCQNDAIYIGAGNGFYRIGLMGSLGHMVYEMAYRDWDPNTYGANTRVALMHQMLDMRTGEFLDFTAAGMVRALRHDPVLLEEFQALPKKQRNSTEALFRFLRIYNERNPLLFPE